MLSIVGQPAIAAQLHKPGPLLKPTPRAYSEVPPRADAYLFLDDQIAQRLRLQIPRPAGLKLVAHKHYQGSKPTELLIYHRS